jgi:hypothetical protein
MRRTLSCIAVLAALCGAAEARPEVPEPGRGAAAAARVSLTVTYSNGAGGRRVAHLRCGRRARADGYLHPVRVRACRHARRNAAFLAARAPGDRQCTQIYGGPQTALVKGTIGSRRVSRRFTRRDGCEIADWDRAGPLLPKGSAAA